MSMSENQLAGIYRALDSQGREPLENAAEIAHFYRLTRDYNYYAMASFEKAAGELTLFMVEPDDRGYIITRKLVKINPIA